MASKGEGLREVRALAWPRRQRRRTALRTHGALSSNVPATAFNGAVVKLLHPKCTLSAGSIRRSDCTPPRETQLVAGTSWKWS